MCTKTTALIAEQSAPVYYQEGRGGVWSGGSPVAGRGSPTAEVLLSIMLNRPFIENGPGYFHGAEIARKHSNHLKALLFSLLGRWAIFTVWALRIEMCFSFFFTPLCDYFSISCHYNLICMALMITDKCIS